MFKAARDEPREVDVVGPGQCASNVHALPPSTPPKLAVCAYDEKHFSIHVLLLFMMCVFFDQAALTIQGLRAELAEARAQMYVFSVSPGCVFSLPPSL